MTFPTRSTVALLALVLTTMPLTAAAQWFPLTPIDAIDLQTGQPLPNRAWVFENPAEGTSVRGELTQANVTIRLRSTVRRENVVDGGADRYFNYWSLDEAGGRILLHGFFRPAENVGRYYEPPIVWATIPGVGPSEWSGRYEIFRTSSGGVALSSESYEGSLQATGVTLTLPYGELTGVAAFRRTYEALPLTKGDGAVYSPTGARLDDAPLGRAFVREEWTWLADGFGIVQDAFVNQSTITGQLVSMIPQPVGRGALPATEDRSWSALKGDFAQ